MTFKVALWAMALFAATPARSTTSTEFTLAPTRSWSTITTTTAATDDLSEQLHQHQKRVTYFTTVFAWPTWMVGHHAGVSFSSFRALAENATENEIRFQPVLDYDKDSCYNQPAINQGGKINEGLTSYNVDDTWGPGCRNASDLENQNVYVRSRCNNGWCAYMYEHYFRKDVDMEANWGPEAGGHRHEWENAVVFVRDGEDMPAYVAHQDGNKYKIRPAGKVRFLGTHAKLVYHKNGLRQHYLRFAKGGDDRIENHKGIWIRGALIGWDHWPDNGLRERMIAAFGNVNNEVRPKLGDCFFSEWLQKAAHGKIKGFVPMTWACHQQGGANKPYGFLENIKWMLGYNDPPAGY